MMIIIINGSGGHRSDRPLLKEFVAVFVCARAFSCVWMHADGLS